MTDLHFPWFKSPRKAVMPDTAPVVNSITFDQASYTKGQKITATVNYTPGTSGVNQSFTGNAADSGTGLTGVLTVTFVTMANDTTTVTASDTGSRVWTKVSDSGTQAVFTATA